MANDYVTSEASYGLLLNQNIKLYREWFKEFTRLYGINVYFKSPVQPTKQYNTQGELETKYNSPILVGCIFEEHPSQQTTKKLGWNAEMAEDASLIHLPYDLEGLQVGALVIVPSAFDNTVGRVFRITKLSATMIYPSSIVCEIVPEYEDNFEKSQHSHLQDTFNLLNEEDEY